MRKVAERLEGQGNRDGNSTRPCSPDDGDGYPVSGRVGMAVGAKYQSIGSPERSFELGLARIIDGVEALLDR